MKIPLLYFCKMKFQIERYVQKHFFKYYIFLFQITECILIISFIVYYRHIKSWTQKQSSKRNSIRSYFCIMVFYPTIENTTTRLECMCFFYNRLYFVYIKQFNPCTREHRDLYIFPSLLPFQYTYIFCFIFLKFSTIYTLVFEFINVSFASLLLLQIKYSNKQINF